MIHRSPEPDIEIPEVTLIEHVVGSAAARGDHPAFIDGMSGEATTYAALAAKVDAAAAALQADGIGKGEVVGLIGPNSAEWGIAYHGILRAGAVVTPMNPLLTPEEIGAVTGEKSVEPTREAHGSVGTCNFNSPTQLIPVVSIILAPGMSKMTSSAEMAAWRSSRAPLGET